MNLPITVTVAVVQGPRILHAPIKRHTTVWAQLVNHYEELQEQLLLPDKQLFPGVYAGDHAVITESDLRKGVRK